MPNAFLRTVRPHLQLQKATAEFLLSMGDFDILQTSEVLVNKFLLLGFYYLSKAFLKNNAVY